MVRKLIVSLLLVAAGLGVLHLVIGFENFASVDGSRERRSAASETGSAARPSIRLNDPKSDQPGVYATFDGYTEFVRTESIELPGGARESLKVFELSAQNSQALAEDLVRLDDVEARLFRIERGAGRPRAVQVATVEASHAFVGIGRDDKGQPSLREDREMDLRDVVLESTAEARVNGLRLTVAKLRALQTGQGVVFRTPSPDEAFELTLGGDQPAKLTGRGVRGVLPAKDAAEDAKLELHVESRPTLTRGGTVVRARGPLDYLERVGSSLGRITMDDEVVVEGLAPSGVQAAWTARGDRLTGTLIRHGGDSERAGLETQSASWRAIRLDGEPAVLLGEDLELRCTSLHVLPGADGAPAAFIADGAPRLIDVEGGLHFDARDRIHIVDLPRFVGASHAATAYPAPWLGNLAGRLIAFEGSSRVVDRSRGLDITAEDGLRVMQPASESPNSLIVGFGAVTLGAEDLVASGSNGFELRQRGETIALRLGPPQLDPGHRFRIERGAAAERVVVRGDGACRIDSTTDGGLEVTLESPRENIVLTMAGDTLERLRGLEASLGPDGGLRAFVATGSECELRGALGPGSAERLRAIAQRIATADGQRFEMTGSRARPARIERSPDDTALPSGAATGVVERIEGERIVIQRVGGDRAAIVAYGGEAAPAIARSPTRGQGAEAAITGTMRLQGAELRFLPGLMPAAALAWHGMPRFAAAHLRAEYVSAQGEVEGRFDSDDGGGGGGAGAGESTIARGDRLRLRVLDGVGRLVGKPAQIDSPAGEGRRLIGSAESIRIQGTDPRSIRISLEPVGDARPQFDWIADGDGSFDRLRVFCDVPVVATGDVVKIDGPLRLRSLRADGTIDPDGVALDAQHAVMRHDAEHRSIEHIVAGGGAELRYRGIEASGEEIRVDVPAAELEVAGSPERLARIVLRGWPLVGTLFRVDYELGEVVGWGRATTPAAPRR